MRLTRKFLSVNHNNYENEINDIKKSLFALNLKIKASYDSMSIEEYDKYHNTRKDLEGIERMLELGSSTEVKRLMLFMSENSKDSIPASIFKLIK